MRKIDRRNLLSAVVILGCPAFFSSSLVADDPIVNSRIEPVLRVAKNDVAADAAPATPAHPLDPALQMARSSLQNIRENLVDYSAILIKRELINGSLTEYEYMGIKIRNRKHANGVVTVPFKIGRAHV